MTNENWLLAIEGKSGENLMTAMLASILRLVTVEGRLHVLRKLYPEISDTAGFKIDCEVGTQSALGDGRIDALIETTRFVIGIEAKLGADFQPDQLKRYWGGLSEKASASNRTPLLVVVAPRSRQLTAESLPGRPAESDGEVTVVTWECMLCTLTEVVDRPEKVASPGQVLAEALTNYYKSYLDPFSGLAVTDSVDLVSGNSYSAVREPAGRYLDALRRTGVIDHRLSRRHSSSVYIGHYVNLSGDDKVQLSGFIGFVSREFYELSLRGDKIGLPDWLLVMCLPAGSGNVVGASGLGLKTLDLDSSKKGRPAGIIQHAQKDGEIFWASIQEDDVDMADLWRRRLNAVFPEMASTT